MEISRVARIVGISRALTNSQSVGAVISCVILLGLMHVRLQGHVTALILLLTITVLWICRSLWRRSTINWFNSKYGSHSFFVRISSARVELMVQLTIRPNEHWPTVSLRPCIESLHRLVLFSFTIVLFKKYWVKQKSPAMYISSLLVWLSTHLYVVILANDDITIHLLDNTLLDVWDFGGLLLLFTQVFDILVIIFTTISIGNALLYLHLSGIFTFINHLFSLFHCSTVLMRSMRLDTSSLVCISKAKASWRSLTLCRGTIH